MNQAVSVSPDVTFQVFIVRSGSSNTWQPEANKLRVCSIASGKVRVKMDEKEFVIGPNGMFKVRSSSACTVENRLYVDSVIHVSTFAEG